MARRPSRLRPWEVLADARALSPFTVAELTEWYGCSRQAAHRVLAPLVAYGLVVVVPVPGVVQHLGRGDTSHRVLYFA